MKPIHLILLTLLALSLVTAALALDHYGVLQKFAEYPDNFPQPEKTADRNVAALGRIEPRSEIIDISASYIDRIEKIVVTEGQFVTAEQVLAYLESYDQWVAEHEKIAAQLDESRARLAAEIAFGNAAIREAQLQLKLIRDVRPFEIEAQEATVRSLTAELANNYDILKTREKLFDDEFQTRRSVDDQRTKVLQAEEALNAAKVALVEMKARLEMDQEMAETNILRAEAAMARARANAAVDSLSRSLRVAETQVRKATVRAPIDGTILKIFAQNGELANEEPILQMGDVSVMHAVAEVYETDVRLVEIGQHAIISSPALENDLTGKVVKIGKLIFKNDVLNIDPAADVDARVVEVRIELDDNRPVKELSNLTVDVFIEVEDSIFNIKLKN